MTDSPRWLDDDQQRVWADLRTVVIALPALLDRQLERDAGISNFEYGVLARLSMTETLTMRLSDLAVECNSTLPRLSKVMARFERSGWVRRFPDPDNGRYTLAELTGAGRHKVENSAPGHVEEVRRLVFEPLSPAQQRRLGAALAQVAKVVRENLDER